MAVLALNSSNVASGFLHRLFKKGPNFNAIIIEVSTTFGLKFQIRTKTNENLFMKSSNSSSSCLMLANATTIKWCGLLIMYWAPKYAISITNESMEFLGNRVYQWSITPFNVVENTRYMIASPFMNKFICVTKSPTCLFGSENPLLQLMFNNFHPCGSCASTIPSTKVCNWVSVFTAL